MVGGVTSRPEDTVLTDRALGFLAAGPADASSLISHVCNLPGAPKLVAEHIAAALFAGRREFIRDGEGRWQLAAESMPTPPDPLRALSYVVVDVETTGGSPWFGHRITEYAAVTVRNGEVVDVFESLVNPERSIPPWVSKLTNITSDMVKDAPRFRDIGDRVVQSLEGNVFVAHNANFDWRFVTAEVLRATGQRLEGPRLCTVRLARKLLSHLPSRSLGSVAHYYGIENRACHRAAGDAIATAQVLLKLLHEARGRGCESWDDLQRLVNARGSGRRRTRRPPASPQSTSYDTSA